MHYFGKVCLLVAGTAFISAHAVAQKKQFTIAEATNGLSGALATKGIKMPRGSRARISCGNLRKKIMTMCGW